MIPTKLIFDPDRLDFIKMFSFKLEKIFRKLQDKIHKSINESKNFTAIETDVLSG
jgi:hypothetical protein